MISFTDFVAVVVVVVVVVAYKHISDPLFGVHVDSGFSPSHTRLQETKGYPKTHRREC